MILRLITAAVYRIFLLLALAVAPLCAQHTAAAPPAGKLTVTILELRYHGLAVVLQAPAGRTWLLDAGERGRSSYGDARQTIAPFLAARDITELAGLLVSHPHGDHFGGAPYILEKLRVRELIDAGYDNFGGAELEEYRAIRQKYIDRHGKHVVVKAGDKLRWDEALQVDVLSPPEGFIQSQATSTRPGPTDYNNNSIAVRVQHGKNVFLFPGDLGGLGQNYLLHTYSADRLKASVLVAAHHGFDSYPKFAAAVKPEVVVVSCLDNYANSKPGYPGQRATEVFGAVGAKVYVTPWHGTVQVTSDGEAFTVKATRSKGEGAAVELKREDILLSGFHRSEEGFREPR